MKMLGGGWGGSVLHCSPCEHLTACRIGVFFSVYLFFICFLFLFIFISYFLIIFHFYCIYFFINFLILNLSNWHS